MKLGGGCMSQQNYQDAIEIAPQIYWVGVYDPKAHFHCNPYLLVNGGESVLFDPGPMPHFPTIARKVSSVVKFEDIFHAEKRLEHLQDLLQFTAEASENTKPNYTQIAGMLEKKIHRSSGEHPGWEGWSDSQKDQFEEICGDLMDQYQYQRR